MLERKRQEPNGSELNFNLIGRNLVFIRFFQNFKEISRQKVAASDCGKFEQKFHEKSLGTAGTHSSGFFNWAFPASFSFSFVFSMQLIVIK